ncbi:DNA-directed RNA polymerase III subunit RPC4-like isoform X2 [Asparagus officinalis]|uniref:DNA-directed RNA polymerase III subunit RPC4-like isoform X1 n=1 Tax=Asparagus officinalis TaxID=4686 RepID=UPI00098DEEAB|nr:DNA-directed RNA polymerase III subunit RPC4-like isoform X1 [Asparagus officinalis]XP_020244294.1 DNA-directed RNA polymerase III subunit RPC4-like isoform X2 [Asparagus officinalis]
MKRGADDDASAPVPKMKFTPKKPPRKLTKKVASKKAPEDNRINKELLARLNNAKNENSFGRKPKDERKSAPVQVAFGHGSSSLARSFGNPRSSVTTLNISKSEVAENIHEDDSVMSIPTVKEYVEPWDYAHSDYPLTLPLRRPYSGDPEILDKEEFGEDSTSRDNMPVSPAEDLGLKGTSTNPPMFLFQLPTALPLAKPGTATTESTRRGSRPTGCTLKDLPSGGIGKMLVYKSGKIKMKFGDALFDVSVGENFSSAQDAAVINVKEKHCCVLSDVPKSVVVTPDVDFLLDSIKNS